MSFNLNLRTEILSDVPSKKFPVPLRDGDLISVFDEGGLIASDQNSIDERPITTEIRDGAGCTLVS